MSRSTSQLLLLVVFIAGLLLCGCSGSSFPNEKTIVVALIDQTEGKYGSLLDGLVKAAQVSRDTHTASGCITAGKMSLRIEFVPLSSGSTPEEAAQAVETAVRQYGAQVILGSAFSHLAVPMAEKAEELKVPMLTSMASSYKLMEGKTFIFSSVPDIETQSEAAAYYLLHKKRLNRLGILYDTRDEVSVSIADELQKAYIRLGGQSVIKLGSSAEVPMEDLLPKMMEYRPEVVFFTATDAHPFPLMNQLVSMGYQREFFSGFAGHLIYPELEAMPLRPISFLTTWNADEQNPGNKRFIQNFQAACHYVPRPYEALAHDTLLRLFEALAYTKGTSPKQIRDALAGHTSMQGAAGCYSFVKGACCKTIWVLQLEGAKRTVVDSLTPVVTSIR